VGGSLPGVSPMASSPTPHSSLGATPLNNNQGATLLNSQPMVVSPRTDSSQATGRLLGAMGLSRVLPLGLIPRQLEDTELPRPLEATPVSQEWVSPVGTVSPRGLGTVSSSPVVGTVSPDMVRAERVLRASA
jgi:hypothetical protein